MSVSAISCACCLMPVDNVVYYATANTAAPSIYCADCIEEIRKTRWSMMKESLTNVDCLASFRSIRNRGLPMTLIESDLVADRNQDAEVIWIKCGDGGREISHKLDADITTEERDNLVAELRSLDANQVTDADIKTACAKWGLIPDVNGEK